MKWSTCGQVEGSGTALTPDCVEGGKLKGLMDLNQLRLNIGWQCHCNYSGVDSFPDCRPESRLKKGI